MPQTSTVQEPLLAVLKWQVIEAHPLMDAWVIAAFDAEEDATQFADAKRRTDKVRAPRELRSTYTIREDPKWVSLRKETDAERELRRRPEVTLELAGRDA